MTDKKLTEPVGNSNRLTDNEIIKALEVCSNYKGFNCCKKCPLKDNCDMNVLESLALDLINRQKAEIETLQKHLAEQLAVNERLIEEIHQGTITTEIQMRAEKQYQWQQLEKIKRAKAEAYKEFVDKLCEGRVSNDNTVILAKCLLKELVGGNDES